MASKSTKTRQFNERGKEKDVRTSNITATKAVTDAVRTSLGPRGMDKMIVSPTGEVVITNDGATILKKMEVLHPAAKMLVELSKSQDIEAGDGTTSVVVLAGSLLAHAQKLLQKGIHPTIVSETFLKCAVKACQILEASAIPVSIADRDQLLQSAITSLNSKVVSQYSGALAPLAVDAVLKVIRNNKDADNVDLRNIRVVSKLGGTIDDTELVDGIIFNQKIVGNANGPNRMENAKIALIQFQLSAPKPSMDSTTTVSNFAAMDRILREEKNYILKQCKQIKATGCNVLLIQKSILRDAVTDLALHFLSQLHILVVRDIERDEVEFISKTLSLSPISSIESFTASKLGTAALVSQTSTPDGPILKITGLKENKDVNSPQTVSILIRGSNKLVLDEADRSLHDAFCVVRSLIKKKYMIGGGGSAEMEVSVGLERWIKEGGVGASGERELCVRGYAEALEVIPATLAENGGMNTVEILTELRRRHAKGEKGAGVNVRKGGVVESMSGEGVVQPLLVSTSAITLATETVAMLLKIDDIVIVK